MKQKPETTAGLDAIREALRARKIGLATLARNLQISQAVLEAFVHEGKVLGPDVLKRVVHELWGGHLEWSPSSGKLRPVNREPPVSLGSGPPPLDPATLPTFKGGPAPPLHSACPEAPQRTKPAWLE